MGVTTLSCTIADKDWVGDVVIEVKVDAAIGEHIVKEVNVMGRDLT